MAPTPGAIIGTCVGNSSARVRSTPAMNPSSIAIPINIEITLLVTEYTLWVTSGPESAA